MTNVAFFVFYLGLFAYTLGCMVVIEDLNSGKQFHLHNHTEEIATVTLQHDGQVLASGGSLNPSTKFGRICIWELSTGSCSKVS